MIILDEHFPESQRQILQRWRISFRQIGYEVGRGGLKDDEIIPLLLQLHQPTLFTLDAGFHKPTLRHARYCLIHLDVEQYEAASFVRRTLKHKSFDTHAKRMGTVAKVSPTGIMLWLLHSEVKTRFLWES
jgi:hypothetical protein